MLPKNEKVEILSENNIKIWIYGQPMSGKTVFADKFPNALMLNTDGNTKFVQSPRLRIKDQINISGRVVTKTLAWDYFKSIIDELEKVENNTYETIVLDLVEDFYQYCRVYIYDKHNIQHESDNSFKMWDIVTNEFLNEIKRLMLLDYNFVLLSHEDTTRDITNIKGDNITQIKPNLRDKISLKLSGMVDLVGRIVVNRDGSRTLDFKQDEVTFGGYRLPNVVSSIDLDLEQLKGIYTGETKEKEKEDNKRKRR